MNTREGPQTDEQYAEMIADLQAIDAARDDVYAITEGHWHTTPDGQRLRSRTWVRYIDPQRLDPSEE